MQTVRRPMMTEPGESLLIAGSAPALGTRFADWLRLSGLSDTEVLLTPLCSVPLPVDQGIRGPRRWAGVNPSLMWHPLMWLPDGVQRPILHKDPDGSVWQESNSIWALRVILELIGGNLFDPDSGTWLDVLSTVGLDIEHPLDLARVEAWLGGADDEALDSIDLSEHLYRIEDVPDWALLAAIEIEQPAIESALAQTANSLMSVVYQALDSVDNSERASLWRVLTNLTPVFLAPAQLDENFWAHLTSAEPSSDGFRDALGELAVIRERYWPSIEKLRRFPQDVIDFNSSATQDSEPEAPASSPESG